MPTSSVAARPTTEEQTRHSERIKGLSDFIDYLGSKEADLTLIGRSQQPLFQYTNLDGLKGVVENHDLWLTHARYSNDEREITLGLSVAKEAVEQLQRQSSRRERPYYEERRPSRMRASARRKSGA